MFRRGTLLAAVAAGAIATSACTHREAASPAGVATALSDVTAPWPAVRSRVARDPAVESRIDRLMANMTLEEKVAQTIQAEATIAPADAARYKLGSVLTGGNGGPDGNEKAPALEWLKLADAYWEASRAAAPGDKWIPIVWGIDAVHGHANIVGATIFPHNIGLGAMRNPELMRRIGEVTAREMAVTGIDWTFAPTLAVVRDDRWGRTYEGFSEDPEIVASYAGALVEGLQGRPGTPEFLGAGRVFATAKHFVGDGGTAGGKDQGDNPSSPAEIARIHGAGYPPAIEAGVQSVMISFSSIRGEKTTGDRDLITGALKERMNFDGFAVGDWNAHGQVPGCTVQSCPQAINAGLDMFMVPSDWKPLYENTLAQARSGAIPAARIDDAVRRILRVKIRSGLFEKPKPSQRPLAGRLELLAAPEHRAVARQAVRESLVLLKNAGKALPIRANANVLVAGDGADNIGKQSGGWTLNWQGTGNTNADFPNGQSIFAGIRDALVPAGGRATLSVDGRYRTKPDVAVVVFGEDPYAEFVGDRQTLEYSPADKKNLELLRRLKADGIPVVSVFLSGRPMWVNPELNASDAFVAAFLPGSEGGGVADVLIGDRSGRARHDFKGKLSYSWPKRADQTPLNRGDRNYDPLFAYDHGLTYASAGDLPRLPEERPAGVAAGTDGIIFGRGRLPAGWSLDIAQEGGPTVVVTGPVGATGDNRVRVSGVDRRAQEDSRLFAFDGSGVGIARISAPQPLDLTRESNGELHLIVDYRLDEAPTGEVLLGIDSATVPITGFLRSAQPGQWTSLSVPLQCFARAGADFKRITAPFVLRTGGRLKMAVSDLRLAHPGGSLSMQCGRP
uniref:glycoside hydrolase family 3 protein n=1 Tax=uncultured Sphingomonas sp. TaxID=158754 RepID=UPI0025D0638E|nr:exo 1,3/1,4-beta-D-glucan glucohydrolase [uncultured Sphingomonas sp.]